MSLTGENVGENTGESGGAAFLVPPTEVRATAVDHNSITLEWAESPKGSAIGYRVVERDGGPVLASAIYGQTTVVVENLTPETSYTLYVVTHNGRSESELSNPAQETTDSEPIIIAPILVSISATAGSDNVYLVYDEATQVISSNYIDGFTIRVNSTARTLTYASGGGGIAHRYIVSVTLLEDDNIDLSYLTNNSDLQSVASGIHVASTTLATYTVPALPAQGVFFFDDFRNATVGEEPYLTRPVIHDTPNGKWKVGREVYISDVKSLTQGKSVLFKFPVMNDNNYSYSELPYQFADDIGHVGRDVWMRMELHVPDNLHIMTLAEFEANGEHISQRNNKGPLIIRGEPNQTDPLSEVAEMWIGPNTNEDENYLRVNLYTDGGNAYLPLNGGKFFRVQDKGTWISIIIHTVLESASGAGDGLYACWIVDGAGVQREVMNQPASNYHSNTFGWNNGYLMGWANVAYYEITNFYMDRITFSTENLL